MAIIRRSIKFPCGYEARSTIKGIGFAVEAKFDEHNLPVCPIHKDNCKKIK